MIRSTEFKSLQCFTGLSAVCMLVGLWATGSANSMFIRLLEAGPFPDESIWGMIAVSVFQMVVPFTENRFLRQWANNFSLLVWSSVITLFIIHQQIGPILFSCFSNMLGNFFLLWKIGDNINSK